MVLDVHSGMKALLRPFASKMKGDFSFYDKFLKEMDKL